MSMGTVSCVGEVMPTGAWEILETEENARLIDVRTQAEWSFVGVPEISELGHTLIGVEWALFPGMAKNPRFVDQVMEALGSQPPGKLMFLCRSGVRSLHAAQAVLAAYAEKGISAECLNVVGGFEGDVDENGHRGIRNGWKSLGLAWRQS